MALVFNDTLGMDNVMGESGSWKDWDLTLKLNELYTLARDNKRKYQSSWRRNYLLTANRQYTLDGQTPWTPNVTDSEIYPILSSRIGWMTDQKITPVVSPASTAGEKFTAHFQHLSDHLEALLDTQAKLTGWDKEIVLALWDAAQFGTGMFKAVWDAGLDDGMGNVALKRVDIWSIFPDPNATSTDDLQYIFEVKKMTFDEIERRFPDADIQSIKEAIMHGDRADAELVRPSPTASQSAPMANPGNLPSNPATVWGLPGQANRNTETAILSEGVNVYECWIRENFEETRTPTDNALGEDSEKVVYDGWRCVVYSGNIVLFDEYAEDLYQANRHPYSRYVDEEMGEFFPTPLVSHLAPCQIAINRILSSVQGSIELTGNPVFMDVKNSGIERTAIVNRPGLRLSMNSNVANTPGAQPKWMEPPKMTTDAWQGLSFWKQCMENISGLSGVSKGAQPAGRQAQQTVQATQEAGFVRVRSSLRNLERTLTEQYNLLANLVVQNYDVPRVMAIVGEDGQDTAIRFAAGHFYVPTPDGKQPMRFSLQVMAGSGNPTSRQARIAEADALFGMHAIDRQAVLMTHNFPHWQEIEQRMEKKEQDAQQQQQQLAMAQLASKSGGGGQRPTGPGTGHPH